MRRIISFILIASLGSLALVAQSSPIRFSDGKPQVAFHLFSTWADNYQANARRGKTIAESILYSGAALSLAGSALTWYGGDTIARQTYGQPMDADLKQNLTLGLGIGGGALLLTGMIVASVPIKDYRAIYADVFEEQDSEVQEAMAVSVLHYQADRGKERRITSFITGLVVPLFVGGIRAGINVASGNRWDRDVLDVVSGQSWTMGMSIVSLFQKTEEERLYDRYLSTRDALMGTGR
jgi:hypothetical protein